MPKLAPYFSLPLALCLSAAIVHAGPAPALSPEAQQAELNRQQAAFAQQQLDQNAANQRAFDAAEQARQQSIQQEQAAYQQRLAAAEAEKARQTREYEDAMAKWKADVAACNAGHTSHCAHKDDTPAH